MTGSSDNKSCEMLASILDGGAFQDLITRQTESVLKAQTGLFHTMASVIEAWTANRRDGAQAALTAFQRISQSEDVGKAMTAYAEWLTESAKRLNNEAAALSTQASALGQAAAAALKDAAPMMAPVVDKAPTKATESGSEAQSREGATEVWSTRAAE
jgi:hypothetical protein